MKGGRLQTELERSVVQWMDDGDSGLSSRCMARTFLGVPEPQRLAGSYPHDPDDLGRCIRFLALFPEFRGRLNELKVHGPQWSVLVDNWTELERLYFAEVTGHRGIATKTYARMRELL